MRCTCGKTFYAWHNPACKPHPLPADGSACSCCGQQASPVIPPDEGDA